MQKLERRTMIACVCALMFAKRASPLSSDSAPCTAISSDFSLAETMRLPSAYASKKFEPRLFS